MNVNEFPLCKNCKYFIAEKQEGMPIPAVCGLSAVNPVTGDWERRPKLAAAFRRESGPCGVAGRFYEKGKIVAEPKPKAKVVKKEEPKPEPKTIKVEPPKVEPKVKEAPKRRRGRPKADNG